MKKGRLPSKLTVRDYFAGVALESLLYLTEEDLEGPGELARVAPELALRAYVIADAMLEARVVGDDGEDADDEDA